MNVVDIQGHGRRRDAKFTTKYTKKDQNKSVSSFSRTQKTKYDIGANRK